MGKSKTKKQKVDPEPMNFPEPDDLESDLSFPVKAVDGHSTQGWTESEVKAYNELIVERQKLEKQRHELEEKCAKTQTQRALLHENVANIDSMFKPQQSTSGMFKFIGSGTCCVDTEGYGSCHHEICKRAKTEGISDFELDTIKYYSMRITTEKSDRIRSALRKQRDLELIRIRKEEEEGQAQTTKKMGKKTKSLYGDTSKMNGRNSRSKDVSRAAKETEKIVNKIINQLDDLRSDLQTGKISAEEAQGKLNILDSKLPAIQDKTNYKTGSDNSNTLKRGYEINSATSAFQTHLRDRLLNAKGDTFTQAFSIMDHFLSATKAGDLQVAITELKDVLQLSGPMCNELQDSLGALEGIFDNPDKLSFTGPDGKQECSSIIDLMDKLKETLHRTGQLPDGANGSLTNVFQECIDLESAATTELARKCDDDSITSADLPAVLCTMKEDFVSKSPIPPLTSKKLNTYVENLIDAYDTKKLLAKAKSCAKVAELEAQITSLVISRTQKQSTKYLERLQRLSNASKEIGAVEGSHSLNTVLENVSVKMRDWVAASHAKKLQQLDNDGNGGPEQSHSLVMIRRLLQNATAPSTERIRTMPNEVSTMAAQEAAQDHVRHGGKNGLWTAFEKAAEDIFQPDSPMLERADMYKEKVQSMTVVQTFEVQAAIYSLYKLRLCPGLTAVLLSQVLLQFAHRSEDQFRLCMRQLSTSIAGFPYPISDDWSNTFRSLALAMVQLYVSVYLESIAAFPGSSALNFAVSSVEMITKHVVLTRSQQGVRANLNILLQWLSLCFGEDVLREESALQEALKLYIGFAHDDKFRCLSTRSCTIHMNFSWMPFDPRIRHIKLLESRTENLTGQGQDIKSGSGSSAIGVDDNYITPQLDSIPKERHDIVNPRKTQVKYPPNYESEQVRVQSTNEAGVRTITLSKEIAISHESAARKALIMLQDRAEKYTTQMVLPPTEVFHAMNDILNSVNANYYHPIDYISKEREVRVSPTTSKFSEHLEKPQRSGLVTVCEVLRLQNILKQLRNGVLGEKYLETVVTNMKSYALSGKFSSPNEAVSGYIDRMNKVAEVPVCFKDAVAQARTQVTIITESLDGKYEFQTRRLKHLLGSVSAIQPSVSALLQLALKDLQALREYHRIIFDKFQGTTAREIVLLKESWSDILQLIKSDRLKIDSPCLIDFVEYAIADWSLRPEAITNYSSEEYDDRYPSYEEDNLDEIVVQGLAMLSDESAMILDSPAKQAVIERRSSMASAVASRATVSSSDQPSSVIDVHHMSTEEMNLDIELKKRHETVVTAGVEKGLTMKNKLHGITEAQNVDRVDLCSLQNTMHNLKAENGLVESHEAEKPKYLLPDNPATNNGASNKSLSTSTPASFRMLDMMKHLSALQRKAKGAIETVNQITRLDKAHGKVVLGVSRKLTAQVDMYADFVEQIAEWNDVELVKEGYLDL